MSSTISVKSGKVKSNGIELYYEAFGNPQHPAIVLIMGLDAQCTMWSNTFYEPLATAGYYVIRFDNRDIGLSTWIENWNRKNPYTLEDMAKDTVGLLDALHIAQTHLIGISMGGMIAQRIAFSYPERVLSLTSLMSSGHSLNIKAQKGLFKKMQAFLAPLLIPYIDIETKLLKQEPTVEAYVRTWRSLAGSRFPFNEDHFRKLFIHNILERKGQNPKARTHQFYALVASGSRLAELSKIKVPVLIVHGTEDKLVPPIHAKIYAPLIPQAKMLWLEGVGHELPGAIFPEIHKELFALFEKT